MAQNRNGSEPSLVCGRKLCGGWSCGKKRLSVNITSGFNCKLEIITLFDNMFMNQKTYTNGIKINKQLVLPVCSNKKIIVLK